MGRIRPEFELRVSTSESALLAVVARALKKPGCPVSGLVAKGRIELHVHGRDQHIYSPQLIVDLKQDGDRLILHGRFGPHPSVWTMFLAAYAACAFMALVGVSLAYAQFVLGRPPLSLWILPAALIAALSLYLFARLGQDLSEDQMTHLKAFLVAQLPQ